MQEFTAHLPMPAGHELVHTRHCGGYFGAIAKVDQKIVDSPFGAYRVVIGCLSDNVIETVGVEDQLAAAILWLKAVIERLDVTGQLVEPPDAFTRATATFAEDLRPYTVPASERNVAGRKARNI